MKRLFSILGLAVLAVISSCTIKEEITVEKQQYPSFYGTMEALVSDSATKAFVDDKYYGFWNKNDNLSIFYGNTYNKKYYYVGSSGTTSGRFDPVSEEDDLNAGVPIETGYNYAIYPYDDYNACQQMDGKLIVPFPKARTIKTMPDGIGASIMLVARSTTTKLPFSHVAGYLGFRLYGDGVTVASIMLKSNSGEPFSGSASVLFDDDDKPQVSFTNLDNEDDPSVTFYYDPPIALEATSDGAKTFWITLPPTKLASGLTLSVKSDNGGIWERSSTLSEIERNAFKPFSPMEVIPEIQTIPVESITVDPTVLTLTMTEAETATLTAKVLPADATDPTVTWSSDNEEVATVENGVVTAHKSGTANITAKAGDKEATCVVYVVDKVSYSFTLTPTDAEINFGETQTYVAKLITTTNGNSVETEPEAELTSSEEGVVTIAGLTVTGAKGGTTTITASFTPEGTEGALTATAALTVKDVVTYALNISPTTDDQPVVIIGKTLPFTLTLITTTNGVDAEPEDITAAADWSSSDEAIATVSGGTATGKKEGTVTLTARYTPEGSSEELSVSVDLTVNKDPNHAGDQTPVEEEEEL